MRYIFILVLSLSLSTAQYGQFKKLLDKAKGDVRVMSGDNTADGLKAALNLGIESAVSTLAVKNGFLGSQYKVLIPQDAQNIINVVKKLPGFQDTETKLIAKMNEAAEVAVKKATPIFVETINGMTLNDAKAILFGQPDAATKYLESNARESLYKSFLPVITSSLNEVNATAYWKSIVDAYNKVPFQKKANPNLDDHVTNKALDGLFSLIKTKEEAIRFNESQRTTLLLQEVFGKLANK
jgi:hypothetical protein